VNASAVPITFAFTGTVNFSLDPSVSVGQAAAGSVTFESTTPNLSSVSWQGIYQGGAITSVTVSVPGASLNAALNPALNESGIVVTDFGLGGPADEYSWWVNTASSGSFLLVLSLSPPGDALVNGVSLPLTPPDLSESNVEEARFNLSGGFFSVTLSSLTLVPEPASALLLGPAALALAVLRCRRQRA
jgi:hypothetical protein